VATIALALAAAWADAKAPGATVGSVALDVVVGVAFSGAALVASGARAERLWMFTVGIAWLAASIVSSAASAHRGFLLVALVTFPAGRVRSTPHFVAIGVAVIMAFRILPQPAVAGVFVASPVLIATSRPSGRVGSTYPAIASAAVGLAVAASWISHRYDAGALDPGFALVIYELVLTAAAAAFPAAVAHVERARARIADEVVSDLGAGGLEGLTVALRGATGDPSLDVYAWDGDRSTYVDHVGRAVPEDARRRLRVDGDDGPLAVVASDVNALADPATAAAVASTVRLAMTNVRLQNELRSRLADLEASRARLLAAGDRTRRRAAEELRDDVQAPLARARGDVASLTVDDSDAARALEVVVDEVDATMHLVDDLVMGVPPVKLGGGRLAESLERVVARSPVPVALAVDVSASSEVETAIFYVVSEVLANAIKHARATRVDVDVRREGDRIITRVADDGRGGADPSGSGLLGLSDRVASAGGHMDVESVLGVGTAVVATFGDVARPA
jgi:signal transduction histidine kinase